MQLRVTAIGREAVVQALAPAEPIWECRQQGAGRFYHASLLQPCHAPVRGMLSDMEQLAPDLHKSLHMLSMRLI